MFLRKDVLAIKNIFDSHCHYDDHAFDEDRYEVLDRLLCDPDSPVDKVCHAATDERSSLFGIETAKKYENFYTSVGFHPECMDTLPENYMQVLDELYLKACSTHKLVAVGEIGLDYHYEEVPRAVQQSAFRLQLQLARELGLPVVVHEREAHEDALAILADFPELTGVFHCYSGSAEMAKELLKRGWYLGFDGPITYKNARKNIETLEICPLDRILIETDSPYLSPVPMRGKRNDSRNLQYIAAKIAEVKGISAEDAAKISLENGRRLFGI